MECWVFEKGMKYWNLVKSWELLVVEPDKLFHNRYSFECIQEFNLIQYDSNHAQTICCTIQSIIA